MSSSSSRAVSLRLGRLTLRAAGLAALAAALLAAVALAGAFTVGAGKVKLPSGKREIVAVTSKGVTLYTLSGETAHRLKCTSAACFAAWPPYKVGAKAKLKKAKGVSGKLSKLRRHGFDQVMLNGHPVYLFIGDGGKAGSAKGDGIHHFGGVWHVIRER
jgi:predicted lipoprotein with Yx(FWY)xxD motif